jgi:hypothetical protein
MEVAVCTLVLVGMGLCQRNLYNLRHTDLGFSARNLIANTVFVEGEGYDEKLGKQLYETMRRTISGLPGVESVCLAWDLPLLGGAATSRYNFLTVHRPSRQGGATWTEIISPRLVSGF